MNTARSLPTLAESWSANETVSRADLVEGRDLLSPEFEDLLTEPNRDIADQIQISDPSGVSNTLDFRSGQLLFFPPPLRPAQEHFRALQKWEGHVLEVEQGTFRARLVPIVGEGVDQVAEIHLNEVEEEDQALIEPGAVFYWSIGYLDRPSGRYRASVIRFRRLPAWTKCEIDSADAEVAKLRALLDVK